MVSFLKKTKQERGYDASSKWQLLKLIFLSEDIYSLAEVVMQNSDANSASKTTLKLAKVNFILTLLALCVVLTELDICREIPAGVTYWRIE